MEILNYKVENTFNVPDIFLDLISKYKVAVFDIETTGLNSSYNKVILIGLLYFENKEIIIKQFFCNKSNEEKQLLEEFIKEFNDFNLYVTFNGASFDIPFLNKRLLKNDISYKIDSYLNIDLCKIARKNKKKLNLKNCKLKTIEKFLGINRKDTISGAESVKLYKQYEVSQNTDLKDKILLHNYEDILHLIPVLDLTNHISLNSFIKHSPQELMLNKTDRIRIVSYKVNNDFLEVKGQYLGCLNKDYAYYNSNYDMSINKATKDIHIRIPLINISNENIGSYSFINTDKLSFGKYKLSEMNDNERNSYLIKHNKEINYYNIFRFLHNFTKNGFDGIVL